VKKFCDKKFPEWWVIWGVLELNEFELKGMGTIPRFEE